MLENVKKRFRRNEYIWRYYRNFLPTVEYKMGAGRLNQEESSIVNQLKINGIARTSVSSLFDDSICYEKLLQETQCIQVTRSEEIANARNMAKSANPREGKSFKLSLLGPKPSFSIESPFACFALHESIVKIAEAYLGMHARLQYFNIWLNFAVDHPPRSSQLWHRDRDDIHIVKGFLYLSDVDENSGPLAYASGTHKPGIQNVFPETFIEGGVPRSTNEQMMKVLPADRVEEAKGPKGTILFADTRGFHRGGLARSSERLLFTFMFTSPNADVNSLMTVPQNGSKLRTQRQKWLLPKT